MKSCTAGLIAAALLLATATAARADTITVSSGSLDHDSDFGPSGAFFNLTAGPVMLFSLFVNMDPPLPGTASPLLQAGQSVAFNTRLTSFPDAFLIGDNADGELQFTTVPVLLPATLPPLNTRLELESPFSMTGFLNVRTIAGEPVFSGNLVGDGVAHFLLRVTDFGPNGGPLGFVVDDAFFGFTSPSSSPTPEPATAILLTAGLAIAASRRRTPRH